MELEGTVRNGIIVLDSAERLPDGTKVKVIVEAKAQSTLSKRLLQHAGKVTGLPQDMADQHDHYIHGTPKR